MASPPKLYCTHMSSPDHLVMNWRSALVGLVIVCSLVCLGHLYRRQTERPATLWLIAFALTAFATGIPMLIGFAGAYDIWPGLTFLPTQVPLWFGPLLYFHAHALMVGPPPQQARWLLLPGVVYWLYQLWAFTCLGDYRSKWAFNDSVHDPIVVPIVIVVSVALTLWSLVKIWQMRGRYLEWLEANRSDDDVFRPVWLTRFMLIAVPLAALWILENTVGPALGLNYFERFWIDFVLLFFVYLLVADALAHIRAPYPKMVPASGGAAPELEPQNRDWRAEGARLKRMVEDNRWYLENSISLQELSRRLGTNQSYVSRALNQGLETSYSNFINRLRVEHAKSLIDTGEGTLLDIALASGFGSKASFNRAFKLHAGVTPSQYRASAVAAASQYPKIQQSR